MFHVAVLADLLDALWAAATSVDDSAHKSKTSSTGVISQKQQQQNGHSSVAAPLSTRYHLSLTLAQAHSDNVAVQWDTGVVQAMIDGILVYFSFDYLILHSCVCACRVPSPICRQSVAAGRLPDHVPGMPASFIWFIYDKSQ